MPNLEAAQHNQFDMKPRWATSSYDCKCKSCGDDIREGTRVVLVLECIVKKTPKTSAICSRCGTDIAGPDKIAKHSPQVRSERGSFASNNRTSWDGRKRLENRPIFRPNDRLDFAITQA